MVSLVWWQFLLIVLFIIIASAVATFIIARKLFKKQLEKNPPINEAAIRAMFASMGRPASEKQIRQVMKSMNEANK